MDIENRTEHPTRKGWYLKPEYQEARDNFLTECRDGGCSCHLSPPCFWCTNEGNPHNQDEDNDAWEFIEPVPVEPALSASDVLDITRRMCGRG